MLIMYVGGYGLGLVFNTTINNISVTLWRPVLLVEETGVPAENLPLVTYKVYRIILYRVHLAISSILTHNVSGDMEQLHDHPC